MSQGDDMEAINVYIANGKPKTKDAAEVRDDWIRWYADLSWWEKAADGPTYDKARNFRTEYNRANAVTKEEKKHVETVIKTGITTEELQGEAKRQLESGEYDVPLLSTKQTAILGTTLGLIIAAGAAVGLGVLFVKSQPALRALTDATGTLKNLSKTIRS